MVYTTSRVFSVWFKACKVEKTPVIFKRRIFPSLGTRVLRYQVLKVRDLLKGLLLFMWELVGLLWKYFSSSIYWKIIMMLNYALPPGPCQGWGIWFNIPWHLERSFIWSWICFLQSLFCWEVSSLPFTLLPVTVLKKKQFLPKVFLPPSRKSACEVSLDSILTKTRSSAQRVLRAFSSALTDQNYLYVSVY